MSHDSTIALKLGTRADLAPVRAVFPPLQRPLPRLQSLDSARLLAAAGVVWVHTVLRSGPVGDLGRFGTTYFTLAMLVFMIRHARRNRHESYTAYAYDRVCRLTVPFAIWSCISTFAACARVYVHDADSVPRPMDVALATASPLWFLHFALLISVLGYPLVRRIARQSEADGRRVAAAGVVVGSLLACLPDQNFEWLGRYYYLPERIWEVLPSVGWGIAVEYYLAHRKPNSGGPRYVVFGLGLLVASVATYYVIGFTIAAKNLGGFGLMIAACATVDGKHWHGLPRLGRLSFGVYLIHPFAISIAHLAWRMRTPSIADDMVIFLTAISLSVVLAWALRRSAYTRWLVT